MSHVTKLLLPLAACAAASLVLAGCGHSDKANAPASADNVEMPAEETMSGLDSSAVPQADPSATATDDASGPDTSAAAADSAASAGDASSGAATPAPSPSTPVRM